MIPFMKLEPRNYKLPRDIYQAVRKISDKLKIPVSTIVRSLIETNNSTEDKVSIPEEFLKEIKDKELVHISIRFSPKIIDWISSNADINHVPSYVVLSYLLTKYLQQEKTLESLESFWQNLELSPFES